MTFGLCTAIATYTKKIIRFSKTVYFVCMSDLCGNMCIKVHRLIDYCPRNRFSPIDIICN